MRMPRQQRQYAESGFYHVVVRGSGRQLLFEDDEDRKYFLNLLKSKTVDCGIAIIAWCLMSNHVHLLLEDTRNELSRIMHRLATAYAIHFNRKAGHVGPVFQDRFTSVPIQDDRQLLQAVRYIHENPGKAGIGSPDKYPWSSYNEYMSEGHVASTALILDMVGGREGFKKLGADERLGSYYLKNGRKIPDEEALEAARSVLKERNPARVKELPRLERDAELRALRSVGLTVKQVERLTGIGANTIKRATR